MCLDALEGILHLVLIITMWNPKLWIECISIIELYHTLAYCIYFTGIQLPKMNWGHLLQKNSQTWHRTISIFVGIHLLNVEINGHIFPSGDIKAQVKMHWQLFSFSEPKARAFLIKFCLLSSPSKTFNILIFSRTTGPISTKLGTKHSWVKGFQIHMFKWRVAHFSNWG